MPNRRTEVVETMDSSIADGLAPHSHYAPAMMELSRRTSSKRRSHSGDPSRGPADVSVPDIVLPDQYFCDGAFGLPDSPEKRLMFAVLLDAISQLRQRQSMRANEAELWIRAENDDGVFSFASVCGVLGFEPRSLALGLLAEDSPITRRAPLRHPRTSRLRVTPHRRGDRRAAAAVG
jgi:hypothetical protein